MKNLTNLHAFFLISALLISFSARATISCDSLRIDPAYPSENDDIRVRSYITIPNCCLPIDSTTIKKNMTEYYWLQTKCADPWHTGESHPDEETCDSLQAFLAQQGIIPGYLSISYDAALAEDCEACMCRTGNIIYTYISVEDSAALGQLGFQRSDDRLYDLVIAYHTEQDPACDCYCQCLDTVEIGSLMSGEHSLIYGTRFIHAEFPEQNYGINDTIEFIVAASLIIKDPMETEFPVYPNPCPGSFRIPEHYVGCRFQMVNLQGKIVREEIIQDPAVSLGSIQAGIYYIRFFRDDMLLGTEKIVLL